MYLTKENGDIGTMSNLFQAYGEDALQPCCITTNELDDEMIMVPRIRAQLSIDEWFGLPQEFRLFVLNAFHQSL